MAKQSGLGSSFFVGTADLSGDVGALSQVETMRAYQDAPAINQSAMDRIALRRDGALAFNAFWNVAAGQAHATLSALPRTDQIMTLVVGSTVGVAAASLVAKQATYAEAFGADGSLGVTANGLGNGYPLEWGEALTTGAQSFATGTVNGTSIDLGATDTSFGAAAYIHVLTMPSGTAVFKVQDSDDDLSFTDVTGMTFSNATGPTSERVQGAVDATVRRYVRLQGSGTHGTSLVVCNFVRYTESPA